MHAYDRNKGHFCFLYKTGSSYQVIITRNQTPKYGFTFYFSPQYDYNMDKMELEIT